MSLYFLMVHIDDTFNSNTANPTAPRYAAVLSSALVLLVFFFFLGGGALVHTGARCRGRDSWRCAPWLEFSGFARRA